MSLHGQWWIWNHGVANDSSYPDGEMKESASTVPWSKECRVWLRTNLRFFSLETMKVKRLEILDEEAMVFSNESFIEENKEEEQKEDSCTKGSRFP